MHTHIAVKEFIDYVKMKAGIYQRSIKKPYGQVITEIIPEQQLCK